jgi:hypothetical protein
MATEIQVRRGTKAALVAHGALLAGEIGFVTDEKNVYVGDGTSNYLVGKVSYGATDPSGELVSGTLYVNTANDTIWFCDGSSWINVGSQPITNLDGLPDGTNYKRVAAADINASNHVTQIYDDITAVTGTAVNTHMSDATKHRQINDAGTTSTDLWSASKIQTAITNALQGITEFQDSVKDKDLTAPPGSPVANDRYIVGAAASEAWSGKTGQIATWNGSAWTFYASNEGTCCYVDDEDILYIYNGISWLPINNYALASVEPGAVSSSTSGTVGSSSSVARADHNHDLGTHAHSDTTNGGQIAFSSLSGTPSTFTPAAHGSSAHTGTIGSESQVTFTSTDGHAHDGSGSTKVAYTNLSGIPASFTPSAHATSHKHGGSDEIATATPAANAIPKAGVGGTISDGWLPTLDGGSF